MQKLFCFGDPGLREVNTVSAKSIDNSSWIDYINTPWKKAKKVSKNNEGENKPKNKPFILEHDFGHIQGIVKISCNYNHTLILTENGEVFSFGHGTSGELGNGESSHENIPCKVLFDKECRIVDVATGKHHSAAVSFDGELYTWGSSSYGQGGHGHLNSIFTPTRVEYFIENNIRCASVACGEHHTVVLTTNGDAYGFGRGSEGQLGNFCYLKYSNSTEKHKIIDVNNLKVDSYFVYQWIPKVVKIMEKQNSSDMKRRFATIVKVCCGRQYSCFLTDAGELYVCGDATSYAIGLNTHKSQNFKPEKAQFDLYPHISHRAVTTDIELVFEDSQIVPKSSFKLHHIPEQLDFPKIVDVYSGLDHVVCVSSNGDMFASGLNYFGECGQLHCKKVPIFSKIHKPLSMEEYGIQAVSCGSSFTAILTANKQLYIFGKLPTTSEEDPEIYIKAKPVQVTQPASIVDIYAGFKKLYILTE